MNPPAPPPTDVMKSQIPGAVTVKQRVELNEYSIRMPQTLTAGPQAFAIVNGGKQTHSFELEGNGIHARLPSDLPTGESATLEVKLEPGTYTVYCPVDKHRGKGMTTTITVK